MKWRVLNNGTPVFNVEKKIVQCLKAPCDPIYNKVGYESGYLQKDAIISGTMVRLNTPSYDGSQMIIVFEKPDYGLLYATGNETELQMVYRNAVVPVENTVKIAGLSPDLKTILIYGGIALVAWMIFKPKHKK